MGGIDSKKRGKIDKSKREMLYKDREHLFGRWCVKETKTTRGRESKAVT